MIDGSFAVEGQYLQILENATVKNLITENWVNNFIESAQNDFDAVNNERVVSFN